MSQHPALTRGVHHVSLTVSELHETRDFFTGALGFAVVGADDSYPAVFLSDGTSVVTLWQAEDPATATPFDRKRNIGLHHLALLVENAAALDAAFSAAAAAWPGVTIEFAPGPTRPGASAHHALMRIPGGIRVELYAPPAHMRETLESSACNSTELSCVEMPALSRAFHFGSVSALPGD